MASAQAQTVDFSGTGVALVTPFKNKQVDYEGLNRLLQHTGPHVDYWVVNGTTAESPTLTAVEKADILAFIKEHNPFKKPIVYGIGGNNTQLLTERLQAKNLEGVSAILSSSPNYNKPSQEGIYQHYKTLAEASTLPIILYNVPSRTGSNMSSETTLRLAELPNIIAIKEASCDMNQCLHIARDKPNGFILLSGDDLLALPMAAIGGKGVISVIANALPAVYSRLVKLSLQHNISKASALLYRISALNELLFAEGNPAGVKGLLQLLGICSDEVRLPLVTATPALMKKMEKELEALTDLVPAHAEVA